MTLSEIALSRLYNQGISKSKFKNSVEAVRWLGAVQAQEYAQAKWSLGLRVAGLTDDDVERDFANGKILRSHLLRSTWHFVAAQDIRWMLKLTAPRVHAANAYMYRRLELNDKVFTKTNKIIEQCLKGGHQMTRNEINKAFRKVKIIAEGDRLSYIMMNAELEGILCSGAREGNQFTYALLDERVPLGKMKSRDEALIELTHRYFTSRGPATLQDFSTWSGLTITDCRNGVESLKTKLIVEKIGKEDYYFSKTISSRESESGKIHLLPIYDEFIMGYKNRDAILKFRNSLNPKPGLQYGNTIVFDGQIIGTWRRTINKKSIDFENDFFKPLSKKQKHILGQAVNHFEKFTGIKVNPALSR